MPSGYSRRILVYDTREQDGCYGLSNFTYKQRLTDSMIYQLPFGRRRRFLNNAGSVKEAAMGRGEVTSILTLSRARHLRNRWRVRPPTRELSPGPTGFAAAVSCLRRNRAIHQWFDVGCLVSPPPYTFRNSGRNILIGPGLETWGLGLNKNFQFTERLGMPFRVETFNALNHANFGLLNASMGNPNAGTVTSVITDAREMQFAARFHW